MLTAELARILREHKAKSKHSQDGNLMFTTRDSHPLGQRNVLRAFCRAATAAGLNPEGVRTLLFHDCRRTFVSPLIAAAPTWWRSAPRWLS